MEKEQIKCRKCGSFDTSFVGYDIFPTEDKDVIEENQYQCSICGTFTGHFFSWDNGQWIEWGYDENSIQNRFNV